MAGLTVPRWEPGAPRVDNLPGVQRQSFASADGAAAIAGGVRAAAKVAGDLHEQEREKARIARMLEADRKLSEWETSTLYAPETGLLNLKGKDALGAPDTALPAFDKLASELEVGMDDDTKLRLRQLVNGRRNDVSRTLARHVAAQSDVILKAEADAYEATALTAIAANAGDPERVAIEKERLWAAKQAVMRGMPAEVVKAERERIDGLAAGAVIDSFMARGDYAGAVAAFNESKDVLGPKADEYASRVKEADLQVRETAEADRIIGQFGAGPAALREARKIDDPFLRERVESRIDRQESRNRGLREDYERQMRVSLFQSVEQGEELTPDQRAAASGVPGLTQALDARARQIAEGVEPVTDETRFYALIDEAAANPAAFAKRDLLLERNHLDNASYKQLVDAQANIKRGSAADNPLQTLAATKTIADNALGLAGLDPSPDAKTQKAMAERVTSMRVALDREVRTWRAANGGKEPPVQELQAMADRLMMPWKSTERGWFFDDTVQKFAFEAAPAPRDPKLRQAGEVYQTPKGALLWDGNAWQPVKDPE